MFYIVNDVYDDVLIEVNLEMQEHEDNEEIVDELEDPTLIYS
jgi:hypothetical protein